MKTSPTTTTTPIFSIFIARQHAYACRARYCYGKSVRLSVTLRYCIEMNAIIVKLFPLLVGA